MQFTATEEQIAQLSANAFNASVPMGLGFLHFQPEPFGPEQFLDNIRSGYLGQDYTQGRMVKLYLDFAYDEDFKKIPGVYKLPDSAPRLDYQSWASTYPTYQALVESVGIKVDSLV